MLQPGASDREITHAAADAAEVAFDRVADAELAHRESTEGSSRAALPSYAVSDAVLDQRTYFVPTMVGIRASKSPSQLFKDSKLLGSMCRIDQ